MTSKSSSSKFVSSSNGNHSSPVDAPIALVTVDDNNKFHINPQAFNILRQIDSPMGVIGIAGLYRTGKSYILNRLLDRQKGFEVGPTVKPCTKGIYMWGKPVQKLVNGETINYIVIDTEGIGSTEKSAQYDAKIFSLCILMSSYFVYNSMGVVDEYALDRLSLIANLTRHIQISTDKPRDSYDFQQYFPTFVWLLRDFTLQLPPGDTAASYLESALRQKSSDASKNKIRETILEAFPKRDCYTVVRPIEDESKLQSIDNLKYETLRPKFREQIENFTEKVYRETPPKSIRGRKLTGEEFFLMVQKYVEAMEKGAVPVITSTWESVVAQQNQKAKEESLKSYLQIENEIKTANTENEAQSLHHKFKKQAMAIYLKISIQDDKTESRGDSMDKTIEENWKRIHKQFMDAAIAKSEEIMKRLVADFQRKLPTYKKFSDFEREFNDLWSKYQSQASGASRDAVAVKYFYSDVITTFRHFFDKIIEDKQAEISESEKELKSLRKKISDVESELTVQRRNVEEKQNSMKKAVSEKENEIATLKQQLKNQVTQLEEFKEQADAAEKERATTEQEKSTAENARRNLEKDKKNIEKERDSLQSKLDSLNQDNQTSKRKFEQFETQMKNRDKEIANKEEVLRAVQSELEQERQNSHTIQQQKTSLQQQVQDLKEQLKTQKEEIQRQQEQVERQQAEIQRQAREALQTPIKNNNNNNNNNNVEKKGVKRGREEEDIDMEETKEEEKDEEEDEPKPKKRTPAKKQKVETPRKAAKEESDSESGTSLDPDDILTYEDPSVLTVAALTKTLLACGKTVASKKKTDLVSAFKKLQAEIKANKK